MIKHSFSCIITVILFVHSSQSLVLSYLAISGHIKIDVCSNQILPVHKPMR